MTTKQKRGPAVDSLTGIGERLMTAIRQRGYATVRDFCKASGVQEATVSRLRSGNRGISIEVLVAICQHLDVSADWLLTGRDRQKAAAPVFALSGASLVAVRDALNAVILDADAADAAED